MSLYRWVFMLLLALLTTTPTVFATPADAYAFANHEEAQRFNVLSKEIRCVVCQNQSLADSNATLATDLRTKIYHMILAQKSDQEIKDFLAERYGEFILLEPRWNKLTLWLWLFPFVGITFILVSLFRLVKR